MSFFSTAAKVAGQAIAQATGAQTAMPQLPPPISAASVGQMIADKVIKDAIGSPQELMTKSITEGFKYGRDNPSEMRNDTPRNDIPNSNVHSGKSFV